MIKIRIFLVSQSPRRRELLSAMGYDFEVVSIDCDEVYPNDLPADAVAGYLSALKAKAFRPLEQGEILMTADTIVALDQKILGKPKTSQEAKMMLAELSGKTHQVYTAITIRTADELITKTDVAEVTLADISSNEIDYYVENYSPLDKAGAYGIQEWLGMTKITSIKGNYYTIMGLPTAVVYENLRRIGLKPA